MNTNTIQLTQLIASEGMVLTNGEIYSTSVYLGINDSPSNWYEIPEEDIPEETDMETPAPIPNNSIPSQIQSSILEINCGMITSLPATKYDSRITAAMKMKPNDYLLGNDSAMTGRPIITTADGSLTVNGTLNEATTLTVWLYNS